MPYKEPEKNREYSRLWRKNNRKKHRKASLLWQKEHPEQRREIKHRWVQTHLEQCVQWTNNRRARIKGAKGQHTLTEWQDLLKRHPMCHYCGRTDLPLERDHVIPVIKGGSNYISNIIPSCKICNCKKGTKKYESFQISCLCNCI